MSVPFLEGKRIGEFLVNHGYITDEQLRSALKYQADSGGRRLGDILVDLGYLSARRLAKALSEYAGVDYIEDITSLAIDPAEVSRIPSQVAIKFGVVSVGIQRFGDSEYRVILMSDPFDVSAKDLVSSYFGTMVSLKIVVVTQADIERIVKEHSVSRGEYDLSGNYDIEVLEDELTGNESDISGDIAIQLVNHVLLEAIKRRATDIHFEPVGERGFRIRLRIDGILQLFRENHLANLKPVVARIKVMSGLDVAERRFPQDGHFSLRSGGKKIDVRVSTVPTSYGEEKAVLRILSNKLLTLEDLGMDSTDLERYREMIATPYGLILITGPTGAGKTTTLYATLSILEKDKKNIMTIEDPVEYRLDGITQMQVNEKKGFTFSVALKHILRQDPDIILVGEIRDKETLDLALQAAQTGHLVFSTLHTNDAASAVTRLFDMGAPPYTIASELRGVVAQRLVNKLCPNCKREYSVSKHVRRFLGIPDGVTVYMSTGCDKCNMTGVKGRTGIFEIATVSIRPGEFDEELSELIMRRANAGEIKDRLKQLGMRTLWEQARRKIFEGTISPHAALEQIGGTSVEWDREEVCS